MHASLEAQRRSASSTVRVLATTDLCDSKRGRSVLCGASRKVIGEATDAFSGGRPTPTHNGPEKND